MYQHRAITEDLYWIGGNDRRRYLKTSTPSPGVCPIMRTC